MKKQHMLNRLTEYFHMKPPNTPTIMAAEILALIEREGMLPPQIYKKEPGHFENEFIFSWKHEWEPEK